ncbi:SMI1/KNR4 family protein [Paenibacillus apiarius]|uniref:SMI1/KNR4 family protein n=1 Tax=Paenibacillus apiarius TaxID=46240 RepID=A0ABT4E0Y3_9BACL|nr:hypothetical protein [Paenibacillus apiarius]MCY9517025.1 SMI1/KNR4 family protein [Paenibacillus apiarius]MCY9523267.1 SMI1/KNR4 family protein [Paenibacillus apiarius]MCY9554235.1 SMI1/KNR4 family protein [Paenibacillus apiarius]MCY9560846.1 SMI1/KNR4 family protein [Paenibacillus apiarius]MCY9682767.1 SMI1/KNR4 family protein [Paenibacillus apiarius]
MYIVSQRLTPVPSGLIRQVEQDMRVAFPDGYSCFLQEYGEGTYRGWFNIQAPDPEVLRPFAEYGLWEHDETSPITQEQIHQCVVIGTTIDGDFLAVHPQVEGMMWMPRHSETIGVIPSRAASYTDTLDRIYQETFDDDESVPAYFEPWNDTKKHAFFLFTPENDSSLTLRELGTRCRDFFTPDLLIENENIGKIFIRELGGYIRLNYAYGREVAVFYEEEAAARFRETAHFLLQNHCRTAQW